MFDVDCFVFFRMPLFYLNISIKIKRKVTVNFYKDIKLCRKGNRNIGMCEMLSFEMLRYYFLAISISAIIGK